MYPTSLLVLATGANLVAAVTPAGFIPASNTDLIVTYGTTAAQNGMVVAETTTQNEPTIGTAQRLTGTSYAVMMVDLDIPFNITPHTLLHWMQTGLTPATTATGNVFLLQNTSNTAPLASYIGPAPPALNPLSHRYTQILVDTSAITAEGTAALQKGAASRMGFDAPTVLAAAGLDKNVVAGNSFNVTNPGPAQDSTTTAGGSNSTTSTGSQKGKVKKNKGAGKNSAGSNSTTSALGAKKHKGNNAASNSTTIAGGGKKHKGNSAASNSTTIAGGGKKQKGSKAASNSTTIAGGGKKHKGNSAASNSTTIAGGGKKHKGSKAASNSTTSAGGGKKHKGSKAASNSTTSAGGGKKHKGSKAASNSTTSAGGGKKHKDNNAASNQGNNSTDETRAGITGAGTAPGASGNNSSSPAVKGDAYSLIPAVGTGIFGFFMAGLFLGI